jgi:hypothetical protein
MAQRFFMKTKKENYWFMFKVLLLVNVILIAVIAMANSNTRHAEKTKDPCCKTRKINADILNSVTVKLM